MFCLNIFMTQCCMLAGVLIEDAVFLAADAAASSSTLGSCAACFSTGSSVLLLPCEFTFLWSILLRLQMGYSFATLLVSVGSLPRLVFIYVPPAYALLVPRYFSRRLHIMRGDVT